MFWEEKGPEQQLGAGNEECSPNPTAAFPPAAVGAAQPAQLSSAGCRRGQGRGEGLAGQTLGQEGRLQAMRVVCSSCDNTAPTFSHFLSAASAACFGHVDLPCSSCNSLNIQHYLLPAWNTEWLFCVHSLQEVKKWQRLWLVQTSVCSQQCGLSTAFLLAGLCFFLEEE